MSGIESQVCISFLLAIHYHRPTLQKRCYKLSRTRASRGIRAMGYHSDLTGYINPPFAYRRKPISTSGRNLKFVSLAFHQICGEYKVCGWVPLIFLQSKHSLCRILKTFSSEGGGIVLPYFYAAAERETKRDVYNFGSVRGMSGRIREIYQEETGKDIIEEFPVSLLCVTKSEEDTHREGEALARELRCRFDQISLDCLEGMNAYMNSITRKNQWWRVRDRRCGEGLTLLEWEQRYWPRVRCVLERDMPQCHMLYGSITQAMGGDSMYTLLEPPMPSQNLENSVTSEGTWAGYCGVM